MTEYEQRVAIGELVERHPQIQWNAVSPDGTATCMIGETRQEVEKWLLDLPKDSWAKNYHVEEWKIYRDYPHDLNAMHEAESSLTVEAQNDYYGCLLDIARKSERWNHIEYETIHTTAAQRAEAFLRTKGLWTD